ncbi:MAG: signal peptidase II, partial [Thermomicrobiales bacterium]
DSAIVWISVFLGLVLGGWFVVSAIESSSTLEIVALGCCAGGAVGNIANRLVSGYVTDFIEVGRWPSFNVADAALTIGLTIFLASHIRGIPAPGER